MAVMGPNLDPYRKEAEVFLSLIDKDWVDNSFLIPWIKCSKIMKKGNIKTVSLEFLAVSIAAWKELKPEGTWEEFCHFIREMFLNQGCADF